MDHTGERYSEQDGRDQLEDESIDLRHTLAALAPDGELVAFAWVRGSVEVHNLDRIDAEGAVVPAARGRGPGRRLPEWTEKRAASLHSQRNPDIPGAVCVGVRENNRRACPGCHRLRDECSRSREAAEHRQRTRIGGWRRLATS